MKIYDIQIPRAIKIAESTAYEKSVFIYDKSSKVAYVYPSLAKELLEIGQERNKNALWSMYE